MPIDNSFSEHKSRGVLQEQQFDPKKCARCGSNGGSQKRRFVFLYSHSARLCVGCIVALGSGVKAVEWLEDNAVFDSHGKLAGFKQGGLR